MERLAGRSGGKVAAQQPFDVIGQVRGRDLEALHLPAEALALPQVAAHVHLVRIDLGAVAGGDDRPHQADVSDLEAGTSAWIYWNMILDEEGGPWLISPIHGDPDGNSQHPVVIVDRQTKQITYTGLYYYLAHFSKFVRPGAVRVGTTGSAQGVRCIAFKSQNGGMVAELMNSGHARSVTLQWQSKALHLNLPKLSITTCLWK